MKIVVTNKITETDARVVFVSQKNWEKELDSVKKELPQITGYLKGDEFKPEVGKFYAYPAHGKLNTRILIIAGIGEAEKFDTTVLRKVMAQLAKHFTVSKKQTATLDLTSNVIAKLDPETAGQMVAEGLNLGSYRYHKYKSKKKNEKQLESVYILTPKEKEFNKGIETGEIFAEATSYARDLINESPTVTTPNYLAREALKLKDKNISVEVFEKKDVETLGMGAYLAVTRGSDEPPKFIKLVYKGGNKKIVLAGKGITFDTGGLSLKDAKNMETMKIDMSGGASVLGIFKALKDLRPKVTVIGLIAACENMPGSRATKPGDVVRAMNGKTIEILNTDAEGRLTLADVLSYAVKEKPDYIVDLATLTGACVVALGEDIAGLFGNNQKLNSQIKQAAKVAGEKIWELPLEQDYRDLVKSHIADLQNIGKGRYGGAITAALFLEEFVDKIPWVHLDIAGPAYAEKDLAITPKGGVGFGVRMLLEWLISI